ncbi:MAG TPA: KOW domain-containing RNA-binding protein [Candidatus Pullilachnospira intestinigallinarum]|nr:KOW domain-containing RNA-binding protein [Candidatus Pullilachnospira intestinigallinarum]
MENVCAGMMARSLAGHDRGKVYLIVHADAAYLYLADGKCRTLDRPKRKKRKHVQIDRRICPWITGILDQGNTIQDSDIIRAIREYGCQQEV